jgi:hypothetical protein
MEIEITGQEIAKRMVHHLTSGGVQISSEP